MRRSMQAGWRMLALRNLHQFRAMTLRHRHTTRWHDLMAQLRTLPDFSAYWEETHFGQADIYSRLRQHHYVHPRVGELRYAVMANTVYRPVVHHHLTALLPLDQAYLRGFHCAACGKREQVSEKWLLGVEINKEADSGKSAVLESYTVTEPGEIC